MNFKNLCEVSQQAYKCGVSNVVFFVVVIHSVMMVSYDGKKNIWLTVKEET